MGYYVKLIETNTRGRGLRTQTYKVDRDYMRFILRLLEQSIIAEKVDE